MQFECLNNDAFHYVNSKSDLIRFAKSLQGMQFKLWVNFLEFISHAFVRRGQEKGALS